MTKRLHIKPDRPSFAGQVTFYPERPTVTVRYQLRRNVPRPKAERWFFKVVMGVAMFVGETRTGELCDAAIEAARKERR